MGFVVAVNNFGDTRSGGLAGPMGLLIIALMAVAVVLLIRNMNKRVRRLPDSFPDPDAKRREAGGAEFDADPDRPDTEPQRRRVDDNRSRRTTGRAESEVNGASPGERPTGGSAEQDRP